MFYCFAKNQLYFSTYKKKKENMLKKKKNQKHLTEGSVIHSSRAILEEKK